MEVVYYNVGRSVTMQLCHYGGNHGEKGGASRRVSMAQRGDGRTPPEPSRCTSL